MGRHHVQSAYAHSNQGRGESARLMAARCSVDGIAGILLAAGRGARFDPTGERDKLLQPIMGGEGVAVAAAKNLLAVLPAVIAVVRPENKKLALDLQLLGCQVTHCTTANEGMAASLVHGLSQVRDVQGWVIALADMPYVQHKTIHALVAAIKDGAQIAAPIYHGRRGNPVAFGREHLERLLLLRGDEGARRLLKNYPVAECETDDPGVMQDIDTVSDLSQSR